VSVEMRLEPDPDRVEADPSALSRFEEIVPSGVAIAAVDQRHGRVALRHPA